MGSVRNWAVGSSIAALILLSLIVAFLMVIVAEMQIDLLKEAGTAADCAIAAGAIGWCCIASSGRSLRRLSGSWNRNPTSGHGSPANVTAAHRWE
jgi:hypothetical protein